MQFFRGTGQCIRHQPAREPHPHGDGQRGRRTENGPRVLVRIRLYERHHVVVSKRDPAAYVAAQENSAVGEAGTHPRVERSAYDDSDADSTRRRAVRSRRRFSRRAGWGAQRGGGPSRSRNSTGRATHRWTRGWGVARRIRVGTWLLGQMLVMVQHGPEPLQSRRASRPSSWPSQAARASGADDARETIISNRGPRQPWGGQKIMSDMLIKYELTI
jgi:hypothetical protein